MQTESTGLYVEPVTCYRGYVD